MRQRGRSPDPDRRPLITPDATCCRAGGSPASRVRERPFHQLAGVALPAPRYGFVHERVGAPRSTPNWTIGRSPSGRAPVTHPADRTTAPTGSAGVASGPLPDIGFGIRFAPRWSARDSRAASLVMLRLGEKTRAGGVVRMAKVDRRPSLPVSDAIPGLAGSRRLRPSPSPRRGRGVPRGPARCVAGATADPRAATHRRPSQDRDHLGAQGIDRGGPPGRLLLADPISRA